ncbi:hypothetical protein L484_007183 [Morus notabilis]|uniref:Uncharacterized protein n=1 Tax=Morus notabilis TaxID=981085 RepID=W9REL1_9ROSA|nr:hypothetical protein L484_007183 [Morus notabilis]
MTESIFGRQGSDRFGCELRERELAYLAQSWIWRSQAHLVVFTSSKHVIFPVTGAELKRALEWSLKSRFHKDGHKKWRIPISNGGRSWRRSLSARGERMVRERASECIVKWGGREGYLPDLKPITPGHPVNLNVRPPNQDVTGKRKRRDSESVDLIWRSSSK